MIRIRDLSLPPDGDMARLVQAAARQLRISPNEIKQLDLKKKSVDARKKNDVRIIYTVDVVVKGREDKILKMAHCPKGVCRTRRALPRSAAADAAGQPSHYRGLRPGGDVCRAGSQHGGALPARA